MRRFIAFVLTTVLLFTLCACGRTAPVKEGPSEKEILYDKYENLITQLESEDYDGARAIIDEMQPAPKIIEVELTMDNLYDYFELKGVYMYATKDADGQIIALDKHPALVLNCKYTFPDPDNYEQAVELGVKYHEELFIAANIDFESWSYDTLKMIDSSSQSISADFFPYNGYLSVADCCNKTNLIECLASTSYVPSSFLDTRDQYASRNITNVEITRVNGTLYLIEKQ